MRTRMHTTRLGAAAVAALLALSACGGTDTSEEETIPAPPPAASDDGGAPADGRDDEAGPDDDDGEEDAADGASDPSASDDGGDPAADDPQEEDVEEGTFLSLFARDAQPNADSGTIMREELASMLEEQYQADGRDVSARCDDELRFEKNEFAVCHLTVEGQVEREWVAHPTWGPPQDGAATHSVLFLHNSSGSQQDLDMIGPTYQTVVGGIGSMYGVHTGIEADQLGADAKSVLEITGFPQSFSSITCEDHLRMDAFQGVECTAEKDGGGTVTVNVLPAPLQNDDRGLMVTVPTDQAQTG